MRNLNWNDVTLTKFNQLRAVVDDQELEYEDKVLTLIRMFYNIEPLDLPYNELGLYINGVKFVLGDIPKAKIKETYTLNGRDYKLMTDIQNITTGQYMDYSNYIQQDATINNYYNILSVFLIPEGSKYNDGTYDINQAKKDINECLSIVDANAMSAFFLTFYKNCIKIFLRYLRRLMKRMKKSMTEEQMEQITKQIKDLETLTDSFRW